jgi:Protein of unknown function (DUF3486)
MPPRSKVITTLPANIRKEVERRMLARRFSDYEGLGEWVREQGYDISHDSLWRYGKTLKQEFTSIRLSVLQARLLADHTPDHKGRIMQALMQVVQHKLLAALAEAEKSDCGELCRLAHAVAELVRASYPQQRWLSEERRQKKWQRRREAELLEEELAEIASEDQLEQDGDGDDDQSSDSSDPSDRDESE